MKKFTKLIFLVIGLFILGQSNAQNTCAAPFVIPSIPFSSGTVTTCGTGNDFAAGFSNVNTSYGGGEDYVYQLNITTAPVTYTFTLGGAAAWKILSLHSACPPTTGNTLGGIANSAGSGSFNYSFPTNGAYYLIVDTWPTPNCGEFTLSIAAPPPPPANDNCAGAIAFPTIPTTGACATVTVNTAGATGVTDATCGGAEDDDVWYSFTVPAGNTSLLYSNTNISGSTDRMIQILSGSCPGTSLGCYDAESGTITGLTAGSTYLLRVFTYGSAVTSNFTTCLSVVPPPPANDNCAGAIAFPTIPTTGACATVTVNTAGATGVTDATCGGAEDDDVWYSFTVPAGNTSLLYSNTNITGSTDRMIQILSGSCPGTSLGCYDAESGTITGLTAGSTYLLRVFTYGSAVSSNFSTCLSVIPPPPVNDNCASAAAITPGIIPGTPTAGSTVSGTSSGVTIPLCDGFTSSGALDVWYSFTANGTSNYTVTVVGTSLDPVVVLYNGTCGALTQVGTCSDATTSNGTETIAAGVLAAGTYYIRIYGYGTGTGGFTVVVTTPPPPVVLICPVNTTVAACQTQAAVNTAFATWLSTASGTGGCGGVLTNDNTGAPSACGGSTTVTFTYTSTCAPLTTTCPATFTVPASPSVTLTCPADTIIPVCNTQAEVNATFATWLASASASGGCNGVLTNDNTGAPSACGGSTTVTFTYTSACAPLTTTCPATFTVPAIQPPSIVTLGCGVTITGACNNDVVTLSAPTAVGVISGNGTNAANFTADAGSVAGTIAYSVASGTCPPITGSTATPVCVTGCSANIAVAETSGTANDGVVCQGSPVTLTASGNIGSVSTYAWSTGAASASISPTASGTYVVTVTTGACSTSTSTTITVNPLPTPTIAVAETSGTANDGAICTGANATLTAGGGTGYAWSTGAVSAGISVNAAGTYTVVVTNANGCTASTSTTITVNPLPTPSIAVTETSGTANDGVLCAGTSATLTAGGGTGYAWSTGAVTAGISVNAAGTYTVVVTNANGCTASTSTAITVNPLPTAFTVTGGGARCATDAGLPVGLSGSQTGVSYQLQLTGVNTGAPVVGTGAAIAFPVQTAGGAYSVVATNTTTGCSVTMTGAVSVTVNNNCGVSISDPCSCLNNATTLTNGQFGETITVNAPTGQTWTVTAISGLYTTSSPAPPLAPVAIAIGATMTEGAPGVYTLSGRHIDAIGYTISVNNGRGTTLSIGNTCSYPNPVITSDLSDNFCVFSAPLTLTGTPGDANITSATFTVDGAAATVFNAATAGIGSHTIVYTVNGGTPKAFGANDPGCIQSVSKIVNVVVTPAIIACNDHVQISLDEDCSTVVLPDMILEGTYGCYDDYEVKITGLLGVPNYGNTVTGANIGQTLKVTIKHLVSGNTCWGQLTVEDKLAPVVTCAPFSIPCAETNVAPEYLSVTRGIAAAYPTVDENCTTYTQTYTDVWVDLPCATTAASGDVTAQITRTWIVTDASGNTGSCTQVISVLGARVWDVDFPADVIIPCAANVNTNPSATGAPYITHTYPSGDVEFAIWPQSNACEIQATYSDQVLPVCDGTFKILRTWTVYDWCVPTSPFPPLSNPVNFIQLIKVVDEAGPSFVDVTGVDDTPADFTASTDVFTCTATVDMGSFVVTDGCSRINHAAAQVTVYDQYTGVVLGIYDVPAQLTTFPGNNLWNPDTLANFGQLSGLPIGTHEVVYTLTDDCGNHTSVTVELTIEDQVPPVAVCDEWTQVALGSDGMILVNANTFDDGSYDNCNAVEFKVRRMDTNTCDPNTHFDDQVKFCCEDLGDTLTVIFRVYDINVPAGALLNADAEPENHYNDCMVQVLVEDKLKPICVAPANVTVTCELFDPSLWAYGQATATDNNTCCTPTITGTVNYSQFDSLCNKGTITRNWTAKDCANNTSTCSQKIVVTPNQNYYIKFPADKAVSVCDGTTTFGEPTFFGEDCELLATSFVDEVFTVVPDACFKIERTWTVINWCTYTPNATCIYVPNPDMTNGPTVSQTGNNIATWSPSNVAVNGVTTNYGTFWSANANCYKYKQIIKIIDTQDPSVVTPAVAEYCDYSTNDANYWNAAYWWDGPIESHNMCEGDADITITATDACSGANISFRYLLFLDLDGNGSMETVVPGSPLPQVYNEVRFDNANTALYAGGTPRAFDFRAVPANQKWGFGLQVDAAAGNNRTAHVRWVNQAGNNAVPQLPYGNHKIKWFVEDGCGNETVSETAFTVKDCKKPTVVCINGLSINQMNGPMNTVTLWASDFLVYGEDNCTPSPLLKYGIRKSGTGTGFPTVNGAAQTSVTFGCTELGTQLVELWAEDKAGNADFCETYVLVQDNTGACGTTGMASVAGALKTEEVEGVEDANVELDGSSNGLPTTSIFTNVSGTYAFNNALPLAANATVTPNLDVDPLNGVNTWDLVLISRHILGLEPLNSPYKLIAADANKSGTVTTFDIVELRKLILGTYNALPNNNSWRFVDKSQQFTDNANPFADVIRENLQIANIQSNVSNGDFVGAKIGDVDGTATPNNLVSSDDRTAGTLLFDVTDRKVVAGEEFTVNFKATDKVAGYQFTMNFNGLEVLDIVPGAGMTMDNFGIFADAVTTSVNGTEGIEQGRDFAVTFRAATAGQLSNMLGVSSRITKAVAFDGNNQLDVAFRYNNGGVSTIAGVGFELYQNAPNPFVNKTVVGFHLPEAAEATLSVYDETGRVLYTTTGNFAKGYNAVQLDRSLLSGVETGVLYYKLETVANSATKKMIQSK